VLVLSDAVDLGLFAAT